MSNKQILFVVGWVVDGDLSVMGQFPSHRDAIHAADKLMTDLVSTRWNAKALPAGVEWANVKNQSRIRPNCFVGIFTIPLKFYEEGFENEISPSVDFVYKNRVRPPFQR
jgi:hypothetical protein